MSGAASSSGSGGASGALGGLGGSLEDKNCDLLCPVCFELIKEAYVTRCGHSFCHACIAKSVELHRRCPKCGAALASHDHIFPNFLLNELVAKIRVRGAALRADRTPPRPDALKTLVATESRHLSMPDVELMLDVLTRRKRLLEAESHAAHHRLLLDFLTELHRARSQKLQHLAREAELVRRDMEHVAGVLRELRSGAARLATLPDRHVAAAASTGESPELDPEHVRALRRELADLAEQVEHRADAADHPPLDEFSSPSAGPPAADAIAQRWRRLHAHFDDFVQCYFSHRADELYFPRETSDTPAAAEAGSSCGDSAPRTSDPEGPGSDRPRGLDAFREDLVAFTRYRALRPLATLSYSSDAINYSTIVSTIEFDKDEEFFAIAGVTKRIKVFEYEAVVRDAVDVHYPCAEMQCSHKISCVSWNAYHKNVLASSDYEGTVSVWDAGTGQRTRAFQEHDKRCWSVHFNRADVRLLASGSDDARVKLWALNAERSVATLEAKFNVCCVRFNPRSSCHLAFGSADHCVHYYDLRAPRAPLAVFRDHRKAVSYVKFLDAETLVSASTDSQLKLWRVESPRCVRSFTGHANEKNFVGLATDGRYVACGSENNALYVYYAGLSRPLLAYRFDALRGFLERSSREHEDHAEFVSAVCWRRGTDVLLAANSQGTIKVLELV